jgi:hypothetical protein
VSEASLPCRVDDPNEFTLDGLPGTGGSALAAGVTP